MKTQRFKTNIKCGTCVATVTPFLNEMLGEGHWKVDTQNPDRILTIETEAAPPAAIRQAVERAGYKAELLS